MRSYLLLLILVPLLAGCVQDAAPSANAPSTRALVGERRAAGSQAGPITLDELSYEAPNATGAWAAAFWIRAVTTRACDFHITGTARPGGGTWDSFGVVASGWKRPELIGRFDHGFRRGDGYVAHAGTQGANHTVKQDAARGPDVIDVEHRRRVDLAKETLVVIGNTYMAPPQADKVGLRLRLACDGDFQLVHGAETPRVLAYGPEDFDGTLIADTIPGFGVQRAAAKSLRAQDGFILLLHEDGNQGNAEYTTTRPDGTTQVDTFGNRVAVGGSGPWRVGLNRFSPSLGGEFRLFALDLAPPVLD